MHDPMTQIYHCRLFTLWHVDPCRGPGGDDSCGWFKRAHHGHTAVLERIVSRFEDDWDRVYETKQEDHDDEAGAFRKETFFCGMFCPNGDPHFSVHGIVLNLFFLAAHEHFKVDGSSNWKKSRRWLQKNLADILMFAENPVDSLFDQITRKFCTGKEAHQTKRTRQDRIRSLAAVIYGWILRSEQKWWQHPRWHVHHWKLQVHPVQQLKRWAFSKCKKCGRRFPWGSSPITDNWNSTGPRWFRGETDIYHADCRNIHSNGCGQSLHAPQAQ